MLTEPGTEVADTRRALVLDDDADAQLVLLALYGVSERRDLSPDELTALDRLVPRAEQLLVQWDDHAASADGGNPADHAPVGAA